MSRLKKLAVDINALTGALNQVSSKGRNILKELENFKFTLEQSARLLNNDQKITQGLIQKRKVVDEISNKLYNVVFDIENIDISNSFNNPNSIIPNTPTPNNIPNAPSNSTPNNIPNNSAFDNAPNKPTPENNNTEKAPAAEPKDTNNPEKDKKSKDKPKKEDKPEEKDKSEEKESPKEESTVEDEDSNEDEE